MVFCEELMEVYTRAGNGMGHKSVASHLSMATHPPHHVPLTHLSFTFTMGDAERYLELRSQKKLKYITHGISLRINLFSFGQQKRL
jgi:hypothetical protein